MHAPEDHGFPPSLRIRTSREYAKHRRRSRVFRTRSFVVSWARGAEPTSRLGLVVSKKVGGSPQRNRVKRLVREWFRVTRHRLSDPWDLVVIARPGAPDLGQSDVAGQFADLVTYLNRRSKRGSKA